MIQQEDINYLKQFFVLRETCDTKNDRQDAKIFEIEKNIVSIQTKLNMLIGILGAIGVAVLGIAIKLLFGG